MLSSGWFGARPGERWSHLVGGDGREKVVHGLWCTHNAFFAHNESFGCLFVFAFCPIHSHSLTHTHSLILSLTHNHTLTHSHTHTLTHTPYHLYLLLWSNRRNSRQRFLLLILWFSLTHSLSLVLVVMMKLKELKTKIYSHARSLIHTLLITCTCYDLTKGTQDKDFSYSFSDSLSSSLYHLYLLLWWNQRDPRPRDLVSCSFSDSVMLSGLRLSAYTV